MGQFFLGQITFGSNVLGPISLDECSLGQIMLDKMPWTKRLGHIFSAPINLLAFNHLNILQTKFKMTKSEFQFCPRWKQIEMRKQTGLF